MPSTGSGGDSDAETCAMARRPSRAAISAAYPRVCHSFSGRNSPVAATRSAFFQLHGTSIMQLTSVFAQPVAQYKW
jgi:hypothetical protein